MNIVIIGVGLIGGSFALDMKAAADVEIYGIDSNEEHLEQALKLGIIDEKATVSQLEKADVVLVAVPVDAIVKILPGILDAVRDDALVMDAGSTKALICKSVAGHPKRRNFLAAHPVSGTEFSGPEAAHRGLYRHKTNIICEVEKTAFTLQERGLKIFNTLGMRIRYMDPGAHDKHIAYVSHLSHISSFMLGKTVIEKEKNERDIFDLASSGFESTVRLAKSSPDMWTPIFEQNRENVIETLEEYIANLQQFKTLMMQHDFEAVYNEMSATNKITTILNGMSTKAL